MNGLFQMISATILYDSTSVWREGKKEEGSRERLKQRKRGGEAERKK